MNRQSAVWDDMRADRLCWLPELGIGFFDVKADPYGVEYFHNYEGWATTPIGERLNAARLAMVARHWQGQVVDIGIGCGAFVAARPNTKGFDVNPVGVEWLNQRGLFCDPYVGPVEAATFFDSLEHIHDPTPLLANVLRWAFVSIPIFRNLQHLLGSKHLKKTEHVFYFTDSGLRSFMAMQGWRCVEVNDEETRIGREDIKSYAFKRS